jgi:transposase
MSSLFFLTSKIDQQARTITEVAEEYRLKGNTLYKQYKHKLSDFEYTVQQKKKAYTNRCFIFPENFSCRMGIDETGLFRGELYTILINKDKHGRKGSLAAIIKGTASKEVAEPIMKQVSVDRRMMILEMTLDMANSMDWIVRQIAPNATKTYDRFHVEKLAYEAMQDVRVRYRWEAMEQETNAERLRVFENGDTRKQLLARARYVLFKHSIYWTATQAKRARILFREYPEIKKTYDFVMALKELFSLPYTQARRYLEDWCRVVMKSSIRELVVVAKTLFANAPNICNFNLNKETNAAVENFNAKIKDFFHRLRGVNDHDLFFYRLIKLYA